MSQDKYYPVYILGLAVGLLAGISFFQIVKLDLCQLQGWNVLKACLHKLQYFTISLTPTACGSRFFLHWKRNSDEMGTAKAFYGTSFKYKWYLNEMDVLGVFRMWCRDAVHNIRTGSWIATCVISDSKNWLQTTSQGNLFCKLGNSLSIFLSTLPVLSMT